MLTLVTSNPAKYAPFASEIARMRLTLEAPSESLPEVQSLSFAETLAAKARAAAALFGRPVLVDDSGLVLEAYAPFPGPLTATVIRSLGATGLRRLLAGTSSRAVMECHLGCWVNGSLRKWIGAAQGRIAVDRAPRDNRMPLTDLFVPDADEVEGAVLLQHRALALKALEKDVFELHLETAPAEMVCETPRAARAGYDCPFCAELEGDGQNVYAQLMGNRLPRRIVYEDEHFVVMPPLGEFMEGGLLLLTREHILSLAHLNPGQFEHLEHLLHAIGQALVKHWGVAPLVFEHGPAPDWSKGVCCVDHAHLNIFPAAAQVHPRLASRMNFSVGRLGELARLRRAEFGYLFVQENDGARRAYDGKDAPTQLVRRIVTAQIGRPERWHWRDYVGGDEMVATYEALKGQIRL
jgi:ATP adenylyltransferase